MVSGKQSKIQLVHKKMKKFYILSIIILLFSSIFPYNPLAEKPILDPNLSILNVIATPDPSLEGDTVHIYVTIKNIGPQNISVGQQITITMTVDNEQTVATFRIDSLGLLRNQIRKENLTWTAALGSAQRRLLHVTVAYLGVNEAIATGEIRINERKTDLLFASTPSISGMSTLGKPITIAGMIKNIGKNTTQSINVSLHIDRTLKQWYIKSAGLVKGESFGVSFSWVPLTFGVHTINLTIDPKQTINEEQKSNNYYETTTSVIPWWNTSWHYRRIYNITGVGNISFGLNFTSILHSLQVVNKTFDNTTITIVRYYTNGTMIVINKTWFNESSVFNNYTNAVGTLSWRVPGPSLYGVYFDVVENRGTRPPGSETLNITPTGLVQGSAVSTQGWWPEFINTFETYYTLNKTLPIQVNTTALAKKVTAYFYWEGQFEFNMSLITGNNLTWSNTSKKLSKRGDWTVNIIGCDDAGYQTPSLALRFYIGKPDLTVSALAAPDVCYAGYNVTITAHVRAFNTTVEHVNVALRVNNINIDTQEDQTIQKDENRTFQFTWLPLNKGNHNVSVVVIYSDSNPGNNKRWKWVTVEGIPDLAVLNITVAPTPVNEGNPVAVTAYISNTGDGNATNYKVILYCEQNENNHTMYFITDRNSTTVSLKKNEYTNVTLTWEQTRFGKASFNGEWAVGIQILNTTQTPDKHGANNYKALFHVLRVIPSERTPPVLSNLEYSTTIEQGNPLLIGVTATDTSGIDTVVISVKTPNKTFVNETMTEKDNDRYEYLFNTVQLGRHDFSIKATDLSPNKNQSIITGSFEVTADNTPPSITYFGVNPFVQLQNGQVEIRCITTDFSGIYSVEVRIHFPDNLSEVHAMSNTPPDTKYIYTKAYQGIGKYVFSITVEDNRGNKKVTEEQTFWVTDDLKDTDNDGMPDAWEEQYGFNPLDPSDASLDKDNDGVTNLQEYQQGTNPLQKLSSSSEFFTRLKDNWGYLTASIIVFVLIVLLAFYGIRRRNQ
ncbi:MAG TPA: CARDB domain-containing protein [Candidatus Thermoplasmatota archaeon]|nr:CARDB domain-containing protein [Candidatus Thermoplasmatota archaeon]